MADTDTETDETGIDAVIDKALANFDAPAPDTDTDEAPEAPARDDGRDDKGRFAKKSSGDEGGVLAAAETPAREPAETVEAQPAPVAPAVPTWTDGHFTGWKPEQREAFAKLPADAQKLVMDRQSETQAFYSRKLAEESEAKKQLEPILEATREVAPILRSIGKAPGELLKSYANIEATLAFGTYADKLKLFGTIAQTYGIPFAAPEPDPYAEPLAPQGQAYPVVHDLRSQVNHLQSQLRHYQEQHEQAQQVQVQSTIQGFASAKAADGSPMYPYFDVVRGAMGQLMADGKAQSLEDAYKQAVAPIEQRLAAELAAKQQAAAAAQAQAVAKAKKAAPIRASGVTATGRTKGASLDDVLSSALTQAGM